MSTHDLNYMMANDLPLAPLDLHNGWVIWRGRIEHTGINALVYRPYEDSKTVTWEVDDKGDGRCRTAEKAMRDAEDEFVRRCREALASIGYRVVKKKG